MIDWHAEIARAKTCDKLLEVARDFLATLTHLDLREVPESCRPTRIRSIEDLSHWHERLVEVYCDGAARAAPTRTHSELVLFFTAAIEKALELEPGPHSVRAGRAPESRA